MSACSEGRPTSLPINRHFYRDPVAFVSEVWLSSATFAIKSLEIGSIHSWSLDLSFVP